MNDYWFHKAVSSKSTARIVMQMFRVYTDPANYNIYRMYVEPTNIFLIIHVGTSELG